MTPLLEVRNLATRFDTDGGTVHAVNGVSFDLAEGEALGLVGESGSGKSVTALSLLGLVPQPPGSVRGERASLGGTDLLTLTPAAMRQVRWQQVAIIFQEPAKALNPVLTVGAQIREVLQLHLKLTPQEAHERAGRWLDRVGIADARDRLDDYPHQFSGGQLQRVMIAMALCCEPALLIADEPTTALDVTIQAQIVELVKELQRDLGMAMLWITHDLGLVAELVDRVAVMYAGRIVEQAPVRQLFEQPRHPYTLGLLRALPGSCWADSRTGGTAERLVPIEGAPPDLREPITGCPFGPRCAWQSDRCRSEDPQLTPIGAGRETACWHHEELHER